MPPGRQGHFRLSRCDEWIGIGGSGGDNLASAPNLLLETLAERRHWLLVDLFLAGVLTGHMAKRAVPSPICMRYQ
jgi:hypothetical protein